MKEKNYSIPENIVTIAIILVVIHTFLEDFAVIINWNENLTRILMIAGFCFDLFFTMEFLGRMGAAVAKQRGGEYFFHQKGWIDFLASVPLLMFNSAPVFLVTMLGGTVFAGFGGILNMLKLIKAIRIARILRLLRILKVFKKIKYTESQMAQRHVTKIITIGITSLVFTLFLMNSLSEGLDLSQDRLVREQQKSAFVDLINNSKGSKSELDRVIDSMHTLKNFNNILIIKLDNKSVYTRYSQQYYNNSFTYYDYDYLRFDNIEVFFDLRAENSLQSRIQSKDSLIFFFIVLILVIAYLVIYSPHFALTVSDPVFVMRKGISDSRYNLSVKIPELYKEDDIYDLARLYNENYLPMKDLNRSSDADPATELKLDDYQDLIDSGD